MLVMMIMMLMVMVMMVVVMMVIIIITNACIVIIQKCILSPNRLQLPLTGSANNNLSTYVDTNKFLFTCVQDKRGFTYTVCFCCVQVSMWSLRCNGH